LLLNLIFFNRKGGTAKSSSSVNIAACLAKEHKKKVLVVDLDSQINATNYLMTYTEQKPAKNISDFLGGEKLKECICPVYTRFARKTIKTGISLMPGDVNMDIIEIPDNSVFKRIKSEGKFDFCIFDCPANITEATIAALCASDYVLIPILADMDSLSGYGLMIDTIQDVRRTDNVGLKILGAFYSNVVPTHSLDAFIMEENAKTLKNSVFETTIRTSTIVPQARFDGRPLVYCANKAAVTNDYRKLVKEILNRISKDRKGGNL